jgi:hypothetical protein
LIALAILSITAFVLISAQNRALAAERRVHTMAGARFEAQRIMAQTQLGTPAPQIAADAGPRWVEVATPESVPVGTNLVFQHRWRIAPQGAPEQHLDVALRARP